MLLFERHILSQAMDRAAEHTWIGPEKAARLIGQARATLMKKLKVAFNAATPEQQEQEFFVRLGKRDVMARAVGGGEQKNGGYELRRIDITGGPTRREALRELVEVKRLLGTRGNA
jgi:hypothetical protein